MDNLESQEQRNENKQEKIWRNKCQGVDYVMVLLGTELKLL